MVEGKNGNGQEQDADKQRLVYEAKSGRLRASVWRRVTDEESWFRVTLNRSYQDASGVWHSSTTFGAKDLLEVAKLCHEVHTWIYCELATEAMEGSHEGREGQENHVGPPPY